MEQVTVNWLAVLAASVVGFAVGGIWYGPLFGNAWMRSLGMDPQVMKNSPKTGLGRIFALAFVLQFGMAVCLASSSAMRLLLPKVCCTAFWPGCRGSRSR